LGGLLDTEALVWSMVVVNLVAVGVGTWATALLAEDLGGSRWWGLAFALNVGLLSELAIDGAGLLATAAAMWAMVMVRRGESMAAALLMSAAVLSREAMLLAVAGLALWLWREKRRSAAATLVAVPVGFALAWAIYVRLRLEGGPGLSEIQEIGWPFVGFVGAAEGWLEDPLNLVLGIAILLLLGAFVLRTIRGNQLVACGFVGFVPLAILFTRQVWQNYFDITRAIAPIITAFVLVAFAKPRSPRIETADSVSS
jgi:hypothetical protein